MVSPMNSTIAIIRAELERLFSLDEMTSMSKSLLCLDPDDVGGTNAKASFAKALTNRCADGDRLDALVDVLVTSRQGVDPRVHDAAGFFGTEELSKGATLGPFTIVRKLDENHVSITYAAQRDEHDCVLKVLRRQVGFDRRAAQRFLTANRMVAALKHPGLPTGLDAGETDGRHWVSHRPIDGQPLSVRLSRTGPTHIAELKPILRGILEPLAAIHGARMAHGDLKLENVLVGREGTPRITLTDLGTDRLRQRGRIANGHAGIVAVFGSPKTIAPEQVRGESASPATDVYAFGAMVYELLSGSPVFSFETAIDAAFAHVTRTPGPPSAAGPRGWIGKDVDAFVLSLLMKDAEKRPATALALLDAIESLGRVMPSGRPGADAFREETLTAMVDKLIAAPDDAAAASALESALEEGANAAVVADAFQVAAEATPALDEEALEVKKSLLHRAARTLDVVIGDKERAEKVYEAILELDPADRDAQQALEAVRKALGKYAEAVESLLARSESAPAGEKRARLFLEIGRICEIHLRDPDHAILAYARALCETPSDRTLAHEIERLAEAKVPLYNEVIATITAGVQGEALGPAERSTLLSYAANWYDSKLERSDLALQAYRQILSADPLNEEARQAIAGIHRKARQWPELVQELLERASAAAGSPRARDFSSEAAEILESQLNDSARAAEIFRQVLADDPAHDKAAAGMARIAERTGDYKTLVGLLEKRADALAGQERADVLIRVGELYEQQLDQLAEAERRYRTVLAQAPQDTRALRGMDRVLTRTGNYRELLENLERQVAIAATPRQKVNTLERMAVLYEEEFLDHAGAVQCLHDVLAVDPANATALAALPRHYRATGQWELLEKLYEKHVALETDDRQRVELLLQRARVLAENVGSPDRSTHVYERVLELDPGNAKALEALARLREQTGDATAAALAIEQLATSATSAEARAEHWLRAGRLLEGAGNLDGAIERYKLAVEAHPSDVAAAAALRRAFAARGDVASVVVLIEKELTLADGKMARSRLFAELARVLRDKMHDNEKAESNAKGALELDATNVDALLVIGDIAYEREHYFEATKHLEPLVARAGSLPKDDAVRVLVRFIEAFGRSAVVQERPSAPPNDRSGPAAPQALVERHPRLAAALQALEQLAPDDVEAQSRVARVLFECNDPKGARSAYQRLLDRHGGDLAEPVRVDALWRLGESLRRVGELDKAVDLLREAADADPANPAPLNALARVYEQTGDWEEFVRTKRRWAEMAVGAERFALLLEIGDAEFKKLHDRPRAAKTYLAALDERPEDRKLLTKLMELFSEERDWASLVEVVLRLAKFVDDPKQRAKYMHTAAMVSARQLGEVDQAIEYYDRALEFDPTLDRAVDEAIELRRQKGDLDGVERQLKEKLEQAKRLQDRGRIVEVLDQLGDLYQKALNEPELAIDAYEAAQLFDPEGKDRVEILANLYASDVTKYLDKAVKAQAEILARDPYRVESYKLLRRLYTEARRPDPAWCLCQALNVLGLAEPDEERFYRRHRADNAAPAQAILDDQDWTLRLTHHEADPIVTHIFTLIQPTVVRALTQPLEALGYDRAYELDTASEPYPVCQTLHYAQGVLGFESPPVFQNPNDDSGLGFVHAHTPSIVLGRAAFEQVVPNQSLAFVAARHLAYYRQGFYVRHLVPSGTGLKGWLFAAVKLCVPQFPIAPDLQGQVSEALVYMAADFQGPRRDLLGSLVSKLLQSGGAIDLKKWVAAIDLTADRVGFLLAHDLSIATEVIRATEDASSVPTNERVKELVLFSIATPYLELREKLQITVDS
jgi:tetratricopeptide (TPR) repeat protein